MKLSKKMFSFGFQRTALLNRNNLIIKGFWSGQITVILNLHNNWLNQSTLYCNMIFIQRKYYFI